MDDPKNASRGERVSLREYVDMRFIAYEKANEIRFNAQEKASESAMASADRAVTKAEITTDERLKSMNEFRKALNDYSRTLMPRSEAESIIETLEAKITSVTERVNERDAASGGRSDLWGWITAAVVALIAIFKVFVP